MIDNEKYIKRLNKTIESTKKGIGKLIKSVKDTKCLKGGAYHVKSQKQGFFKIQNGKEVLCWETTIETPYSRTLPFDEFKSLYEKDKSNSGSLLDKFDFDKEVLFENAYFTTSVIQTKWMIKILTMGPICPYTTRQEYISKIKEKEELILDSIEMLKIKAKANANAKAIKKAKDNMSYEERLRAINKLIEEELSQDSKMEYSPYIVELSETMIDSFKQETPSSVIETPSPKINKKNRFIAKERSKTKPVSRAIIIPNKLKEDTPDDTEEEISLNPAKTLTTYYNLKPIKQEIEEMVDRFFEPNNDED